MLEMFSMVHQGELNFMMEHFRPDAPDILAV